MFRARPTAYPARGQAATYWKVETLLVPSIFLIIVLHSIISPQNAGSLQMKQVCSGLSVGFQLWCGNVNDTVTNFNREESQ